MSCHYCEKKVHKLLSEKHLKEVNIIEMSGKEFSCEHFTQMCHQFIWRILAKILDLQIEIPSLFRM